MSDPHGHFVWYELMTTDTKAARAFYSKVVGWAAQDGPMLGYSVLTAGQTPIGGLMNLPQEARKRGAPPSWLGYVAVDDVDAAAERARQLGASAHVPPTDIPNVGRFSVIIDPQMVLLALFKSAAPRQDLQPEPGASGRVGWHELMTINCQKALAFYDALFGWEKADLIGMGGGRAYQLFSVGGQTTGGICTKPPAMPVPFWLYYFNVGDIDVAADCVIESGGQILNGPMEVPGGDWIVQGADPQGAMFALVGKRGTNRSQS